MTMVVVTHEMGFAREVGDRVVFMDERRRSSSRAPGAGARRRPRQERTRRFLSRVL